MKATTRSQISWLISALITLTASVGDAFDTEYSNAQAGIRMKVIGFGQDVPLLRIENSGTLTLAIRNDVYLAITFWDGNEWVKKIPPPLYNLTLNGTSGLRSLVDSPSKLVTFIAPKTNIEIPLYEFWFSADDGKRTWRDGIAQLPKGKHQVRLTTNCMGMTALDHNFTPFDKNFNIPPFDFEIK